MNRLIVALCCFICLFLGGCSSESYKLANDYASRDTFGFLVFISESGKQYDDLWVNISGLNKTFLASTAQIVNGEVKGTRYGAQQGTRQVMIRQKNERLLYQGVVDIYAGKDCIILFKE